MGLFTSPNGIIHLSWCLVGFTNRLVANCCLTSFLKLTFRIWSQVMWPWKKPLNFYREKTWDDLVGQKANLKFKRLKLLKRSEFWPVSLAWMQSIILLISALAASNFQQLSNQVCKSQSQTESCKILLWSQMYIYCCSRNFAACILFYC